MYYWSHLLLLRDSTYGTKDIFQAYLQSASKLLCEVYLRPNKHIHALAIHIEFASTVVLTIIQWRLLACDFRRALEEKLGMQTVAIDICLFFRRARGRLTRLIASYFDDTLACGDSSFSQLTEDTRKKFEVKSREFDNMWFSRVYIDRSDNRFNIH